MHHRWIGVEPEPPSLHVALSPTPDVVIHVTREMRYQSVNILNPLCGFQWTPDAMIGKHVTEFMPANLLHQFAEAAQLAIGNGVTSVMRYATHVDGLVWFSRARVSVPAGQDVIVIEISRLGKIRTHAAAKDMQSA